MILKKYGIAPLILLYMAFATTFSIGKAGVSYGTPTLFIAIRMLFSGFLMLTAYALMHKKRPKFEFHDINLFFQATLFGIYLTYIPEFWALQYLTVAKSAFIFMLAPFCTAFFAYLRGFETFSSKKLLGLSIGMIGFLPLVCINAQNSTADCIFSFGIPELVTMGSVVFYAYSWIVVKELVEKRSYSSWIVNGVAMFAGGLGALITSFFWDDWVNGIPPVTEWSFFLLYILLITIVGIFCYALYSNLLRVFSPTLISFFGFTEPFFAAFYGWLFLGETTSWIFFISLFVVAIGLYLFYQEDLKIG